MTSTERPPITDSPWFWVLLFALMALGALVAIGGKYGRRQVRIERQYQARERIAAGAADDVDQSTPRPYATPEGTLVPLWPLAAVLGIVVIVAVVMLVREQIRQGQELSDSSSDEPHGP